MVYAQQASSDDVEMIMDGKRYGSIHEYRLTQIKNILISALSADNLQAFTDDELCEVIKEVRDQQISGKSSSEVAPHSNLETFIQEQDRQSGENGTLDLDSAQMQEMLQSYYEEHEESDPILIDPKKVKSILIEPK